MAMSTPISATPCARPSGSTTTRPAAPLPEKPISVPNSSGKASPSRFPPAMTRCATLSTGPWCGSKTTARWMSFTCAGFPSAFIDLGRQATGGPWPAKHDLGKNKVRHPAEPGDGRISGRERNVEREAERDIDSQGHRSQCERDRTDHPDPMLLAVSTHGEGNAPAGGAQPGKGQQRKPPGGHGARLGRDGQPKSSHAGKHDGDAIDPA